MKHTSGPWDIDFVRNRIGVIQNQFVLKNKQSAREFIEEAPFNLKLIAAAPELLETCKNLLAIVLDSTYEYSGTTQGEKINAGIRKAEKVIAKAEGRVDKG